MNVCGCEPKEPDERLWCDTHLGVTFGLGVVVGLLGAMVMLLTVHMLL